MKGFVVLDIETSGFTPKHGEVLEIAAVYNGEVIFETLVKATVPISEGSYKVHGISFNDTQSGMTFAEAVNAFRDALPEDAEFLVAHNTAFEMSFLRDAFITAGITLPWLCTLVRARKVLPRLRSHKNEFLFDYFKGDKSKLPSHLKPHRAAYDSLMTEKVLEGLIMAQFSTDTAGVTRYTTRPDIQMDSNPDDYPPPTGPPDDDYPFDDIPPDDLNGSRHPMEVDLNEVYMPFGKHRGQKMMEIPLDYLEWVSGNVDDINIRNQAAQIVKNGR